MIFMNALEKLPAPSVAVIAMLLSPAAKAILPVFQLVVPEAVPDIPVPPFSQTTEAMPLALSDAVPDIVIELAVVLKLGGAGFTIVTTGFVVSRMTVTCVRVGVVFVQKSMRFEPWFTGIVTDQV
jgi:hypothetical protein